MSVKLSFLISGLIHTLLFLFYSITFLKFSKIENLKIHLKKGTTPTVTLSFLQDGSNKNSKSFMSENLSNEGTLRKEIEKFKTKFTFHKALWIKDWNRIVLGK